jgi:hypothetical protein
MCGANFPQAARQSFGFEKYSDPLRDLRLAAILRRCEVQ